MEGKLEIIFANFCTGALSWRAKVPRVFQYDIGAFVDDGSVLT